jgi:adenylylsulfate kinase-like enzyme
MLAELGMDVTCGTISLFRECQERNKDSVRRYCEIFLSVPMQVLIERNQKQLYSRALRGEIENVMGVDIPMEEPLNPDLIVWNDSAMEPEAVARSIWERRTNDRGKTRT